MIRDNNKQDNKENKWQPGWFTSHFRFVPSDSAAVAPFFSPLLMKAVVWSLSKFSSQLWWCFPAQPAPPIGKVWACRSCARSNN